MWLKFAVPALACACLLSTTAASPLPDSKHATAVTLDPASTSQHMVIDVTRVDKLTSDSDGSTEGLKLTRVAVGFDVDSGGALLMNGAPVKMGFSHITTSARMGYVFNTTEPTTAYQIKQEFNTGIVSVDIHVSGAEVQSHGIDLRRIIILVSVTEVDGCMVSVKNVVRQVFTLAPATSDIKEVSPCGPASNAEIRKFDAERAAYTPEAVSAPSEVETQSAKETTGEPQVKAPCPTGRFHRKLSKLWHRMNTAGKVGFLFAVILAFGVLVTLMTFLTIRLVAAARARRAAKYAAVAERDAGSPDAKKGDMAYVRKESAADLPAYTSNGYAKVEDDNE